MFRKAILLSTLLLAACGSTPDSGGPNYSSIKSEDMVAQRAIREYIAAQNGPANSQFQYVMEDMNGDGTRDVIALINLPYTYWCGMSGCTMAVFEGKQGGFAPVTEITSVYGPVVITDRSTFGWRDLAVRASGTNVRDRDVALQFDGRAYPTNPAAQPTLPQPLYQTAGRRIFP